MTVVFSSLVALVVLGAAPEGVGLPLGIPPGPEDRAIARVAPEKCLFYVNWAGAAAPDPASRNEMEQLLAEPEVQVFLKSSCTLIRSGIRQSNESDESPSADAKEPDKAATGEAAKAKAAEAAKAKAARQEQAELTAAAVDLIEVWLTHPTAIFVADVRVPAENPAKTKPPAAKPRAVKTPDAKPPATKSAGPQTLPEYDPYGPANLSADPVELSVVDPLSLLGGVEGHAGLIVALGSDAPRVRAWSRSSSRPTRGRRSSRSNSAARPGIAARPGRGRRVRPARPVFRAITSSSPSATALCKACSRE